MLAFAKSVLLALALVAVAQAAFNFRIEAYFGSNCEERLARFSCAADTCCAYSEGGETGYFVIENYDNSTSAADVIFNGDECNSNTLVSNGADCSAVSTNGTCFSCGILNYKVVESSASSAAVSVVLLAGSLLAAFAL